MNERDATLLALFSREEPDTDRDAFAAAVRQRVAGRRIRTKALELGALAGIVLAAGAVIVLNPESLLYPVMLANRVLASPLGALAGGLGAMGVAWWSRYGEA